jgi:hypothetical protein
LYAKLAEWEKFNTPAPHGAHKGKTPYEALRETLESRSNVSHPVADIAAIDWSAFAAPTSAPPAHR